MSILTKKALETMKKEESNKLTITAIEILLDKGTKEDITTYIKDLLQHGCVSGMEGTLIYYSDTIKFYEDYKTEINALLYDLLNNCGFTSAAELLRDWDKTDPLAIEQSNQNLLAWFGFEETIRNIGRQFEDLEGYV